MSQVRKPDANSLKEREAKRRQVFKPILDNPLTQADWPFIAPDVAKDILGHLSLLFAPVKVYNNGNKAGAQPAILDNITIGFNATNEALENQAKALKQQLLIRYIFVAKYDLNPPLLTNHFPTLSYTASQGCGKKVKLVQLPRGAISDLSEWANEPNTGVLGLSGDIPQAKGLYEILDQVTDVEVPYLKRYKLPAIDFLKTTMPIVQKNNQKAKKGQEKETAKEGQKQGQKSGDSEKSGKKKNNKQKLDSSAGGKTTSKS